MSAMLIRDPPQRVHDWLKAMASENRRSLNQQIIVCLESAVAVIAGLTIEGDLVNEE